MADVEVSTTPIVLLEDGGYFVNVNDAGAPRRTAVSEVHSVSALAHSAVQPGDLGTAAYEDVGAFAPMSMMVDISAALEAILAGGD